MIEDDARREEQDRRDIDVFGRWLQDMGIGDERTPRMEEAETATEYIARLEVPGMERKDITVRPHDDGMEVIAERRNEEEHTEKGVTRTSMERRRFVRYWRLPAGVDPRKANAKLKNGILEIRIPKASRKGIEVDG